MWLELQIFGFRALWSPYYLLFVLSLCLAYYLLAIRFSHKFTQSGKPETKQIVFFYTGMALLYLIKGGPVDLMSHIMFTAHMMQMAVYYLVFPILVIKGVPEWIWRKLFSIPVLNKVLGLLTVPLIALLLFNGLFSMYHLPAVFDFAKANAFYHAIITTVILFTAFCVWWPVFTPFEEKNTMHPLLKMGFIFANGVLITPACALIIFSDFPLYTTYSETGGWLQAMSLCVPSNVLSSLTLTGPEMFSPIPVIEDQQLGGILMKVTQEIVYGFVLANIFFSWFKAGDKIDPAPVSGFIES